MLQEVEGTGDEGDDGEEKDGGDSGSHTLRCEVEAPSTAGLALETAGHGPVTRLLCDSLLLSANWRAAPAERAFRSCAGPVPILGVTWESWLTSLSSHCLSVPCPHQPDCRALGEAIDHRRHAVTCLGQQANLIPPLTLLKIFFLKAVLLRYSSHTVRSTHLKRTNPWFLGYFQSCPTVTTTDFRTCTSLPERRPVPISSHCPALGNYQSTSHLWICLSGRFR